MTTITSVAVQADGFPTQFYIDVPSAFNVVQDGWQIGTWQDQHGFELNAITQQPSTLKVFITGIGFPDAYTGTATAQMFVRTLPLGWSVTESIYYDTNNQPFAGTLLDMDTFTVSSVPPGDVANYPLFTGNPFSMSVEYSVIAVGPGEITSDINVGHAVPGPEVGSGLSGLLVAGMIVGLWCAKRRKQDHANRGECGPRTAH